MDKRRRVPVKEAICVIEKSMEKTLRHQKLMSICVFFQPFLITLRFDRDTPQQLMDSQGSACYGTKIMSLTLTKDTKRR